MRRLAGAGGRPGTRIALVGAAIDEVVKIIEGERGLIAAALMLGRGAVGAAAVTGRLANDRRARHLRGPSRV
jgi:uncharacterized membrane protein (DUF4010 family)